MEEYKFRNRNLFENLLRYDEKEEAEQLKLSYKISLGNDLNPKMLTLICSSWIDTTFISQIVKNENEKEWNDFLSLSIDELKKHYDFGQEMPPSKWCSFVEDAIEEVEIAIIRFWLRMWSDESLSCFYKMISHTYSKTICLCTGVEILEYDIKNELDRRNENGTNKDCDEEWPTYHFDLV